MVTKPYHSGDSDWGASIYQSIFLFDHVVMQQIKKRFLSIFITPASIRLGTMMT